MPFREIIPYKNFILNQENYVDGVKLTISYSTYLSIFLNVYGFARKIFPQSCQITVRTLDYGKESCELYA